MDLKKIEAIVGEAGLCADPADCEKHRLDGIIPKVVARPQSVEQVAALVRLANDEGFSLAPSGGGTMSSIGGKLKGCDLVLATDRLDKIIDMDTANLTATVQAGVRFADFADLLAGLENRCFFPLDSDLKEQAEVMCSLREYKGAFIPMDPPLAKWATIGGIAAANTTGPRRLRYGLLRDVILGLRFVSPLGQIVGMGGKTVKNVSGYDVSKLMIGSQGCLGVLAEVTFRLLPLPEKSGAMLLGFPSLDAAGGFLRSVLDSKLLPSALELLNPTALALCETPGTTLDPGGYAVAIGQAGFAQEVAREVRDLKDLSARSQASSVEELDDDAAQSFWQELADAQLGRAVVKFKASYRFSHYLDFMAAATEAAGEMRAALSVSASSGQAHVYLIGEADPAKADTMGQALRQKCTGWGGALLLEAAPSRFKEGFDPWGPERSDRGLMQGIKRQLDPAGVLSPGRFLGGI